MNYEDRLKWHNVKKTANLDGFPKIKGYDFSKEFDFKKLLSSFSTTGFQATNLGQAIQIIKTMQREKASIFLAYTSNMVSSGVREIIKYLVQHKKVDMLVTSAGGVEEDIIKTFGPFHIGSFDVKGEILFDQGISRIGNLFVPNERYLEFELFMNKFFELLYQKQLKTGKPINPSGFIRELGLAVDSEESIYYWAAKNNIPVFCPALTDGAIGDLVYFFKHRRPEFVLDVAEDVVNIVKQCLNTEKAGGIILGAGVAKHHLLNSNIFRDGLDYAVYINTAQEFDGSDSGARAEEAITWAKIKPNAPHVKVFSDATIAFPLIVAGAFVD